MSHPDLLDPAAQSQPGPGRRVPVLGITGIVLSVVSAGLLFLPPTRLIGLVLVLPLGVGLVALWFRRREQTNGPLTVAGLAVLAVTLGIGVAMTLGARTTASTPPALGTPTVYTAPPAPDPDSAPAPGTGLVPATRDAAPPAASTHESSSAAEHHGAASKPEKSSAAEPPASQPPSADNQPERRDRADSDRTNADSSDADGNDSGQQDSEQRNPNTCSLGQFKINDDGTADVCGDQDANGDYVWRRHVPPPDDDHDHHHH